MPKQKLKRAERISVSTATDSTGQNLGEVFLRLDRKASGDSKAYLIGMPPAAAQRLAVALIEAAYEIKINAGPKSPVAASDDADSRDSKAQGVGDLFSAGFPCPSPANRGFGQTLPEATAQAEKTGPVDSGLLDGIGQRIPEDSNELLNSIEIDPERSDRVLINGIPFNLGTCRQYLAVLKSCIEAQTEVQFAANGQPVQDAA